MISNITIKACIGLVDEDVSVRRALERLLKTHGYSCATYESAEAALGDPLLQEIQCIIIDVQLAGMNGFELCDRLDALEVRIPRIFITAHVQAEVPDRLGHCALLIKPFEEKQLIASIENSLKAIDS